MKTVFIAFSNNVAEHILSQMEVSYKLHTPSSESGITRTVNKVLQGNYQRVVALGMYSGKDQDKLRIETVCNKRFRNQEIDGITKLNLSQALKPIENVKYAKGLGNSWCNLLSTRMLNHPKLQHIEYSFIHIPKTFNPKTASRLIQEMINNMSPLPVTPSSLPQTGSTRE